MLGQEQSVQKRLTATAAIDKPSPVLPCSAANFVRFGAILQEMRASLLPPVVDDDPDRSHQWGFREMNDEVPNSV